MQHQINDITTCSEALGPSRLELRALLSLGCRHRWPCITEPVSRDLRRPAVAGVQSAKPLLPNQLARCLEEVRIVDRRVVRHVR